MLKSKLGFRIPRSSTEGFPRIYPPGRGCHTKSFVRPLRTDFNNAHLLFSARHGYEHVPREVLSEGVFLKHLQCVRSGEEWSSDASLCQRQPGPVDYTVTAQHGVDVCKEDS